MLIRKLRRSVFAALCAVALLSAVVLPAFAWPGALEGAPVITPSSPVGYYIWHDDGFHVRTHGPGEHHHFVAHIHSDGLIENVDAVRLENRDKYRVVDGDHTLVLDFDTYDFTDGVNFTVRGGSHLTFDLELDGAQTPPHHIFLGPDGRHPRTNPFIIWR